MKLSESVKPISYLKAHASQILHDVASDHKTYVITQNGEAKAVLQDVTTYEQTQDSLALLKMLAQSSESMKQGRVRPARKALGELRKKVAGLR